MTTQPFAWEFEGKPEWGFDYGSYLFTACYPVGENAHRYKSKVTNFRKAKVVDEDAVVINKKEILGVFVSQHLRVIHVKQSEVCQDESHTFVNDTCKYCGQGLPVTKTYLTTEQFIKVYKSFNDEKLKELKVAWRAASSAARYEAWYAAWHAAYSVARDAARSAARSAAWNPAWNVAWDANLAILTKDKITKEQFNLLMHPWTSCDLSPFVEDWEAVLNPKVEEPKVSQLVDNPDFKEVKSTRIRMRRKVPNKDGSPNLYRVAVQDAWTKNYWSIHLEDTKEVGCLFYGTWEAILERYEVVDEEPKNFGAVVEASHKGTPKSRIKWVRVMVQGYRDEWWSNRNVGSACWSDLINPTIISEGVGND